MNVIRRRILILVTAAVVAATVAAGLAFARSTPASIGTGVVRCARLVIRLSA